MDPAVPELPTRPSRSSGRSGRLLLATAGTALLAVTCVAATAAARENSSGSGQVRQAANLSAAATSALTDNWYESAPYYSVLDSAAPDLGTVMAATGQKAFDVSFILADGSSCTPAWNGTDAVSSDTQVSSVINEVRVDQRRLLLITSCGARGCGGPGHRARPGASGGRPPPTSDCSRSRPGASVPSALLGSLLPTRMRTWLVGWLGWGACRDEA